MYANQNSFLYYTQQKCQRILSSSCILGNCNQRVYVKRVVLYTSVYLSSLKLDKSDSAKQTIVDEGRHQHAENTQHCWIYWITAVLLAHESSY